MQHVPLEEAKGLELEEEITDQAWRRSLRFEWSVGFNYQYMDNIYILLKYIYYYGERERESELSIYLSISIYIYVEKTWNNIEKYGVLWDTSVATRREPKRLFPTFFCGPWR